MSLTRRDFVAATAAFSITPLEAAPRLIMNDASKLNPTPVHKHFTPNVNDFIPNLRRELKEALNEKRPVAFGAARHSMNGQSLAKNGTVMTFDINQTEIDTKAKTYKTHAGTRWFQVMEKLDKVKLSPKVMQSNSDFGIGATYSVNAHGWPCPFGAFGATVISFRLMLADGEIVNCSRAENVELFGLVMGGYGLFGVILDLEVEAVDNMLLKPTFEKIEVKDFANAFIKTAKAADVKMIYGRLNVARNDFYTKSLLVSFRETPGEIPPISRGGGFMTTVSNKVYRSQIGSEAAKKARWVAESSVAPKLSGGSYNRSALMNEPVHHLAGNELNRTDILHEYFVSPDKFNDFVTVCRAIIPKAKAEFLNVTLRYIAGDPTSVMAFAPVERIAAVMSFSQETTPEGEADMMRLSESLTEAITAIGGSFYLPYRLQATPQTFKNAYKRSDEFFVAKRKYDPNLLFRNGLWETYHNA